MHVQDLLLDWFRRVWVEGDLSAIDDYFDGDDSVASGILTDARVGAEDYRALVPALRAHLRAIDGSMNRVIVQGDWLGAQYTLRALSAHTSDRIEASGLLMMRVEGGKVREAYNTYDFIALFEQLRLLPRDALMLLMSGDRLQ